MPDQSCRESLEELVDSRAGRPRSSDGAPPDADQRLAYLDLTGEDAAVPAGVGAGIYDLHPQTVDRACAHLRELPESARTAILTREGRVSILSGWTVPDSLSRERPIGIPSAGRSEPAPWRGGP